MCSIIITPCELTSQKLLGKKKRYMGLLTLLWFCCSFYQMKQESDLLRKSVTALVLIPPLWFPKQPRLKVDLSPGCDVVPVGRAGTQSPLSARAVLSSQPSWQGHCQAALCCWKNVPCQSPKKWNNSQHWGKNNHGLKINTVEIALGVQTHAHAQLHLWKKE